MSILYDYIQLDVSQVPSNVNLALLYLSVSGITFTRFEFLKNEPKPSHTKKIREPLALSIILEQPKKTSSF